MIERVTIRRFKRFADVTFTLPGHVVIAGPNNCGKTTMLQAITAWDLALTYWKQRHDFQRHRGFYAKVPVARQAFTAVPLRAFDLLWNDRKYSGSVEIAVRHSKGWSLTMEWIADSTEQVYVRPKPDVEPNTVRQVALNTAFVPPMTGLSTGEPVYQRPKVEQLLGQGKPGDVIRNLLVEAHQSSAWDSLRDSIARLFHYEILPPDATGADIIAEYQDHLDGPRLDIASAGSGFQQVLMLLTFLHIRPGSILLLDEPDAHLHVILQDAIYGELRSVAAQQNSQLIISTHSEVIINSVEPRELCVLLNEPKLLDSVVDRKRLAASLGVLSNTDILLAHDAPGILYVDGYTDINILVEWAKILNHPACETLTTRLFWKPSVWEPRPGASGIKAEDHYDALKLIRADLPGLVLLDGDDISRIPSTDVTGTGLQRLRWNRYEIESYLVHPKALERFIEKEIGAGDFSAEARKDMLAYLEETFTPAFLQGPLKPYPLVDAYLQQRKARTEVIPPILDAAGLHGFPYTRFNEIAAAMLPEEIHPEVKEKLDAIQQAFRL
ncbi:MAG: AAA family ATPase [Nitrospira sp.]|nr:AAA family ATPase [Nitrospira sp.]